MFKSIVVPLNGIASDGAALNTAFAIARDFGSHVDGLHVRLDPASVAIRTTGAYDLGAGAPGLITAPMMDAIQSAIAEVAAHARENFERAVKAQDVTIAVTPGPQAGVTAAFSDIEGRPRHDIAAAARLHDLTVCATPSDASDFDVDAASELLMRSGRPLLLAPDAAPARIGRNIAIAWKDSAESARAVSAAMPLLAAAATVAIVTAPEAAQDKEAAMASAGRLAEQLRWHGIAAQTRCATAPSANARAVVEEAKDAGADLLVMGGYGHSRAREYILGGFTRAVLCGVALPVFIAH